MKMWFCWTIKADSKERRLCQNNQIHFQDHFTSLRIAQSQQFCRNNSKVPIDDNFVIDGLWMLNCLGIGKFTQYVRIWMIYYDTENSTWNQCTGIWIMNCVWQRCSYWWIIITWQFLMVSWTYFDWWMHSQFLHFFETQCFVACWLFIRFLHHRGHFVGTLKPRLTTVLQKFNALIHLDLRYFWTRSLLVWHQPTSEDKNIYLRFSTNESGNFQIHGFADEKCS